MDFVEFKNVGFKYPDSDEEVLSDISFTAKPGETTAIIGTNFSVTDAKRLTPPIKINAEITAKIIPTIQPLTPKAVPQDSAIELD